MVFVCFQTRYALVLRSHCPAPFFRLRIQPEYADAVLQDDRAVEDAAYEDGLSYLAFPGGLGPAQRLAGL